MLEDVGIENALPGFDGDIDAAIEVYKGFKTTRGSYGELEAVHGAVAIDIEPLAYKAKHAPLELIAELESCTGTDDEQAPWSRPSTIF